MPCILIVFYDYVLKMKSNAMQTLDRPLRRRFPSGYAPREPEVDVPRDLRPST